MAQLPELRQRIDHLIKRYLQNLDQGTLDILAAGGYSNGEQLAACDADGITVILPNQRSIDDLSNGYPKSAYTYDADQDCYICPAGERLIHKTVSRKEKRDLYTREGCHTCVLKPKCTKAKKRRVGWHFSEDVFWRCEARLLSVPRFRADAGKSNKREGLCKPESEPAPNRASESVVCIACARRCVR